MKMYIPGKESEQDFNDYLELTVIRSGFIREAMRLHLVKGLSLEYIVNVDPSNLKRALDSYNKKMIIVERIKERAFSRLTNLNKKGD